MTLETFLKLNFAGGVAGIMAWVPVYPIDSIKSIMQVGGGDVVLNWVFPVHDHLYDDVTHLCRHKI